METLDKVDLQILRTLQENARLTTKELASRVSLSSTPVFERLKRLENNGYIKKYIAVLDAEKLNQGFIVFCNVKMSKLSREIAQDFTEIIRNIPEVTECYNISGSFDYLLKIHAPNINSSLIFTILIFRHQHLANFLNWYSSSDSNYIIIRYKKEKTYQIGLFLVDFSTSWTNNIIIFI